jgi:hypothetical protein
MSEIAQQLHEIAYAIGKLSGAVLILAIVVGASDFDGKVARAIDRLALKL